MDDRELSTQVGNLDLDEAEPVVTEQAWRFCDKCKAVLVAFASSERKIAGYWPPKEYWTTNKKIFETSSPLETAITQGCPMCLLLFSNFPPNAVEKPVSTVYSRRNLMPVVGKPLVILKCKSHYTHGNEEALNYSKDLQVVRPEDFKGVNESFLGLSTASSCSTAIFSKWINDCVTVHEKCKRISGFLPTRLVDVGFGDKPRARLVLGKTLSTGTRYVTLSHCWGQSIPKKLLTSSTESMMEEIQVSELSQTFQDAMIVTCQVGQRYIWIDSLCIVQDDGQDWSKESSMMGQIYSMSYCNISATGSDGSSGLFFPRNLPSLGQCKVSLTSNRTQDTYYVWDHEFWESEVENSPLNRRGWVVQERFLSPCNLHFGAKRLFWECNQLCASEEFPRGIPKRYDVYTGSKSKRDTSASLKLFIENPSFYAGQPPVHIWEHLLGKYTASKLTYDVDKLVAIGGLAALMGKASQHQYVAGLWKERLPGGLLWRAQKPSLNHASRQYTAPSWSWASIDEKVENDGFADINEANSLVSTIDVKVELASDDIYGQVKSGNLTMGARLARIRYRSSGGSRVLCAVGAVSEMRLDDFHCYWDGPETDIEDPDAGNTGLFLIPVIWIPHLKPSNYLCGLILKATEGSFKEFRRLGLFFAWEGGPINGIWEACEAFDKSESGLEYGLDEKGRRLYTISLI